MARQDQDITYDYDKDRDVLYAFVGRPRPCVSVETPHGVLLRRDMETGEFVGFTIINYARKLQRGSLKSIVLTAQFPHVVVIFVGLSIEPN